MENQDYKEIILTGKYSNNRKYRVSSQDFEEVSKHSWNYKSDHVIVATIDKRKVQIHRYIYFLATGLTPTVVDHINNDPLDGRRQNLRQATTAQNCANRSLATNNTSGVKNVLYEQSIKAWIVRIQNKIQGKYQNIDEAMIQSEIKSREIFGSFSKFEINEEKLNVSREFDIARAIDGDLNFQIFRKQAKYNSIPNKINFTRRHEEIKEIWKQLEQSNASEQFNKIHFTGKHAQSGEFAIVNSKYFIELNKISWFLLGDVPTTTNKTTNTESCISMHRYIFTRLMNNQLEKNQTVDHINRNAWCNTADNLRAANPSQQTRNQDIQSNNTSGFVGVWKTPNQKWASELCVLGKKIYMGTFIDKRYACYIYDITLEWLCPDVNNPNYKQRGFKNACDFGDTYLTIEDLQNILSTIKNSKCKNALNNYPHLSKIIQEHMLSASKGIEKNQIYDKKRKSHEIDTHSDTKNSRIKLE
jgi:hypothetical protein